MVRFDELGPIAQKAAAQHLLGGSSPAEMAAAIREHAGERFGVLDMPTQELTDAIMLLEADIRADGWESWDAYHEDYQGKARRDHGRGVPEGSTEIWPIVLDLHFGNVLDDGWHRFHAYCDRGEKVVPAIFYAPDE
jgi:hypothetical protein